MKILSIQHYSVYGGPHNEIVKIESYLNMAGFETVVVLTNEKGNAYDIIKKYVKVYQIKLSRFRNTLNIFINLKVLFLMPLEIKSILRIIKSEKIDAVKVHGLHNPHGVLAALLGRKRVIWVLSSNRLPFILKFFGSLLISVLADVILTNGKTLQKDFYFLKYRKNRIFHYYPPITKWDSKKVIFDSLYENTSINFNDTIIGMVGNISPHKGVDFFVNVASRLVSKYPSIKFVIIGSLYETHSSFYRKIKTYINNNHNLNDRIFFLGYRENVQDYLSTFRVSVIPSRWEGTTTTAGESLSVGTPVVAFNVGAISEIISHGETGYLATPYNIDELSLYIFSLIQDHDKYKQFSMNAKNRSQNFLAKICADTHIRSYNSLRGS